MTDAWLDAEADAAIAQDEAMTDAMENSESWSPKDGEEIRGKLVSVKIVPTKYGPKTLLTVNTKDAVWDVWSAATLDRALLDQKPALNRGIVIKYGGKGQGDGYEYHKYYLASEPKATDDEAREAMDMWIELMQEKAAMSKEKEEVKKATAAGGSDPLEAPF